MKILTREEAFCWITDHKASVEFGAESTYYTGPVDQVAVVRYETHPRMRLLLGGDRMGRFNRHLAVAGKSLISAISLAAALEECAREMDAVEGELPS